MRRMRKNMLAGAAVLALGASAGSQAGPLIFDPDGASGPLGNLTVGSFDWAPNSFLAVGGTTAFSNFQNDPTCPGTSCDFRVLTHASMVGIFDPNGNDITPAGLGQDFEITMVASIAETVVDVSVVAGISQSATFLTKPNASDFLELYYEASVDANPIDGFGYNNGDLILRGGSPAANVLGSFMVNLTSGLTILDATPGNGDQYTGPGGSQMTVQGSGSQENIPVNSLVQDFDFFKNQLDTFGIIFANISTGLPFVSVDPSDCFTPSTSGIAVAGNGTVAAPPQPCLIDHVDNPMSFQTAANGGMLPDIGINNGLLPIQGGGEDFLAQTDFNSPVSAQVPEPGSLALLGMGLLGVFGVSGIRRRSARA